MGFARIQEVKTQSAESGAEGIVSGSPSLAVTTVIITLEFLRLSCRSLSGMWKREPT